MFHIAYTSQPELHPPPLRALCRLPFCSGSTLASEHPQALRSTRNPPAVFGGHSVRQYLDCSESVARDGWRRRGGDSPGKRKPFTLWAWSAFNLKRLFSFLDRR